MSPPKPHESPVADPGTPRRPSAAKHGAPAAATPTNRRSASAHAPGATPKSAPAASGHGAKKKPEPTLLADFLLGRPSPARVAAQRSGSKQRRKSVALDAAGVREELRQEMRAAAVRRLQQPNGVTDRVKQWQKTNAAAMKKQGGGVPNAEDVASEPTEVAVQVDAESVTEEDRVRIKLRQKRKQKKEKAEKAAAQDTAEEERARAGQQDKPGDDDDEPEIIPKRPQAKSPPKKRIVSDENWMKRKKGRSPPGAAAAKSKPEASPTPIPKDFLQRTAQNPTAQNKVKEWAKKVELPDPPKVKQYHHPKSGATVTVEEEEPSVVEQPNHNTKTESRPPVDDGIRVRPMKPMKPKVENDDGIRIYPMRKKAAANNDDDGIRIRPSHSPLPDDGIRVTPIENLLPDDGIRVRPLDGDSMDDGIQIRPNQEIDLDTETVRSPSASRGSVERSTKLPDARRKSVERNARMPSARRGRSPDEVIEVIEESETEAAPTPTRRPRSLQKKPRQSRSPTVLTQTEPETETTATSRDERSVPHESDLAFPPNISDDDSDIPHTILGGNKPLADIPFGYSAFSELDLPLGADAKNSKRPKAQRNPSFKAVPNVFKKVVSGAKEIIHDKVDPPKPVVNQPPSIESWLNDTVDPFVEGSPRKQPAYEKDRAHEKEWGNERDRAQEAHQQTTADFQRKGSTHPQAPQVHNNQENNDSRQEDSDASTKKGKSPAYPNLGLKRSRATRGPSSPLKSGTKKPFREALKAAFRGESGGHKLPPTVYPSCEAESEEESDHGEDERDGRAPHQHSPDSSRRSPSPDPSSTVESSQSSAPIDSGGLRRRPPTKGVHELSTILSEESRSSFESDTISTVSQTTVTQTTAFTKESDISRQRSQRSGGLKRRLTKHSDLVSVLSLPDDGQLAPPSRSRSLKSSRSLHRKPSRVDKGRIDDLLDEFADDEHFYQRELKTLVDGVIPVLLTQVVHSSAHRAARLSTIANTNDRKSDSMSKSVVSMGMALEKLRDFHRRVPLSDMGHLLSWLEAVSTVYDQYLNVWRLGFQDVIVNLAPAAGKPDDEDSLLNALPRNEEGDVLGENGERVDVAYLLKRPLIRVKWMTKFLRAALMVVSTPEVEDLLVLFENLQEKARKRHREETARMTDEDANNTDTSRARDLRNLAPLDNVSIDQTRQVAAKDSFALDLDHSGGQRLECQVELIHRDNLDVPSDRGDVLIRDIASSTRPWLLFPAIPKESISARRGGSSQCLVVMVRGMHNRREWFELIKLSTNDEEQVADWLEILGSHPFPPMARSKLSIDTRDLTPTKADEFEIPVGERKLHNPAPVSPIVEKPKTPSRYHARTASAPSTPTYASHESDISPSSDRTPTQEIRRHSAQRVRSLPVVPTEDQVYEPAKPKKSPPNSKPYREDGAPPPPIHRTLAPKSPTHLVAPVEIAPVSRIKRRTSSPLKHEYRPSDGSSDSSSHTSDDSDSFESSSDELDEDDVPDTLPGYSIKKPEPALSVVSESSITPSNSASQIGALGQGKRQPEYPVQKFLASVSYWSNKKGVWKDVGDEITSILVHPGSIEVHRLNEHQSDQQGSPLQSSGTSEVDNRDKDAGGVVPLVSLILTPVIMIRLSTAVDLEVRSRASHESRLKIDSGMFRFRASSQDEAKSLYEAVHQSRLQNARYIQLSEEARFRSFGQQTTEAGDGSGDGDSSGHQRTSWFGRKNSYRASTRAPSISQASGSTSISASSFLKRLTGGGNLSFNIDRSTVDKQSRPGSMAGGTNSGSLYTSSASSSGGGGSSTPPRSLSISLSGSGSQSRWSNGLAKPFSPDQPLEIRCHLNVQNNRWSDKGDCILVIKRPPPGVRQELALYHGMEKRIIVTHASKKNSDKPMILLDAVLGSKCFSMIGSRGIMCSVWENLRDEDGNVGVAPKNGALAGKVTKWCFQCKNMQQASLIMGMVTSEIPGLILT
ncbi:hypothetical protein B0T19DRAFT_357354 [Cercophora scortea]|uniref:Uncharacterized protein n=1 Tax=Cercophora scortea TaxID=314031 RepID=A0AAE0IMW6_9PEZI|nr:hypothetical protein B0T19DRAFT_357354 [Cercophora scortea]